MRANVCAHTCSEIFESDRYVGVVCSYEKRGNVHTIGSRAYHYVSKCKWDYYIDYFHHVFEITCRSQVPYSVTCSRFHFHQCKIDIPGYDLK